MRIQKAIDSIMAESRGSRLHAQRFYYSIYVHTILGCSLVAASCRKKDASQAGLTLSTMTVKAACLNLQGSLD